MQRIIWKSLKFYNFLDMFELVYRQHFGSKNHISERTYNVLYIMNKEFDYDVFRKRSGRI